METKLNKEGKYMNLQNFNRTPNLVKCTQSAFRSKPFTLNKFHIEITICM